ncbi:TrbG/VirB9 family P-type conjugative transfer protein [Janthinobacterium sp. FW305-128]|uniref:TrbG/VirB9 family P-type conjugative transfer protein n=1 Tax=Janthinobacterium sp. FW305-128 TaxID=2775055 RepID=UPI001E4C2273|nr:TrbG/VirB9 family P-type conjugative transfer protein [Janthinobacterium sp. FW305-128]MCC7684722.1 TrbG/VirB9 family P-type conjugative transfer protein [Janthinobacterium sp. FW305-128]
MNFKYLILLCAIAPTIGFCAVTPRQGVQDERIRIVDYAPENVINISTYYGVSTLIKFSDDEKITDRNGGDPSAWTIREGNNYFFVQPKELNADTNYTVMTSRSNGESRLYHFALFVEQLKKDDKKAWQSNKIILSLQFAYPEKKTTVAVTPETKTDPEQENKIINQKLSLKNQNKINMNFDYWAAGPYEISPTSARDDGRFIYLTFSSNRDMPAVFEVDSNGSESIAKTNIQDATIVVEKMTRKLILRQGDAAVCIVNKSFDINGEEDNSSGTVSDEVERTIKE